MKRGVLLTLMAAAGIAVAMYAHAVENELAIDPGYVPLCKLSIGSCVSVFTSEYAHPLSLWGLVEKGSPMDLGLPVAGMLNYGMYLMYPTLGKFLPAREGILLALCTASIIFSIYLLYVLKFIIRDFCIVCTTFHVINFSVFFFVALPEFRNPSMHQRPRKLKPS
jgi:uncharacterized membrane protein